MSKEKVLYFEAQDGISGDMTLGALIDLGADADQVRRELDKFVPEKYGLVAHPFERNGIHGINLDVLVEDHDEDHDEHVDLGDLVHQFNFEGPEDESNGLGDYVHEFEFFNPADEHHAHGHRHYSDIQAMIRGSGITERAKSYALAIFDVIADAEAAVHRTDKDKVAFHEVGAMDSIIDIVGTAIAVDLLGATRFFCAAPHDGSGTIVCRHGIIPVPVPAVMEMAKDSGIPIVIEDDVNTEMITPTGYGILKGLGAKLEPHLGIHAEKVGYGFGNRNTGRFGAVRITLGTLFEEE
ncbi:MAG: LarC family nickel insertion protein [Clostridiales Family XIII bacterium]|jgi:uncharacterized protein (DUF111 family)|nr:LarC family nickel insertion protein [Clostridiales Family XIII bacterium]